MAPSSRSESKLAQRAYLIICLSIYGGALGAASLLVNLLSRTKYPNIPEHMELAPTLLMSAGAFVVCAALGGLIAYWSSKQESELRNVIMWLLLGFVFGLLSPFITGGTLPLIRVFMGMEAGVLSTGEAPVRLSNALFYIPGSVFHHGAFGLFTGFMAGALFGVGAFLMSTLRESVGGAVGRYGPYVLAIALSIFFYAIATLGPAPSLAKLG